MTEQFHSIGLIGKHGDGGIRDTLLTLSRFLSERGREVLLEEETALRMPGHELAAAGLEEIGKQCDLAMVVGGDGTLLHTARSLVDHNVPLLGINLGRLGFLADISPEQMITTVDQILAGQYDEEHRSLLQAQIGENLLKAFNDVVIHKWNVARMIELETYVDGHFVNTQRSDGLIVSTPTGSTAYALSGGGPIVLPSLNATILVPVCPHTLSNRPIVVDGDSEIEIVVSERTPHEHVRITCDGLSSLTPTDGRIFIRKHDHPIRLIHPKGHDHFNLLRAKLGWSAYRA
jgi:NAD+ kinase